MKRFTFLAIMLCAVLVQACTPQDSIEPTPQIDTLAVTIQAGYTFKVEDLDGLVLIDTTFLDGRQEETGQYVEGASILVFEKEHMWATGYLSPYSMYGHITKWTWKLDKHGTINLRADGDPDTIDDHKHECQIKATKNFPRKFTKEGLPEKLRIHFSCNDGLQPDIRIFHLPLPFGPSAMFGTTIHWDGDTDGRNDAVFQGDHFRMRKEYQSGRYIGPLLDPYKGGSYQHSIHIDVTDINRVQDKPDTIRNIGKQRLFLFEHTVPKHGKLVSFSYCPIIFTPEGENGYANQRFDRFELCSIYRIANLTQNAERPLTVDKSINANVEPFHSALGFD